MPDDRQPTPPTALIARVGVRYATGADLPMIVDLARREHAASVWAARAAFSPQAVEQTVSEFVFTPGRTALVSDAGYLLGLVQPMGFSSVLAALEFAWYAEDGKGLDLLKAFDAWGQRMGAQTIVVHDYFSASDEQSRLAGVLRRRYNFTSLGTALHRKPGIATIDEE